MKMTQFISRAFITAFVSLALNGHAQINLNSSLLAHYPFDGNTNSTAGVSGYDLTNYSTTLTTDHYGNANSAYYFNGSNYMAGSFGATGYTGMTVSAWINTTYNSNYETIWSTPWSVGYVGRFSASHFMTAFDGASGNNASTDETTVSVENGWTFVTATNDGSTTSLYVNGVLNHSYSESLVSTAGNGHIQIGNTLSSTDVVFNGTIDEVRVYTRALSAKEILALYQMPKAAFSGSGTKACVGVAVPFTDESDTIVAYNHYLWRFGDGTTDTVRSPKHIYKTPGSYTVWMVITSPAGSADSTSQTVKVNPTASARFSPMINGYKVNFIPHDTTLLSYTWDFGDSNSSSAKRPLHIYAYKNTFNVTLTTTNTFGCDSTYTIGIDVNGISGTMEIADEASGFLLYPNPAKSGTVTLNFHHVNGDGQLSIISMDGRVILKEILSDLNANDRKTIDISGWRPGVYAIKLETEKGVLAREMVKQ